MINSKNHILFIDDIQQILRSGSKEKDTDLSSWIGDILANGEVSVIATTTFKDYRNTIEINTSISRKLQKVVIEPTSIQETIEIIEKTKHYYEDFHNVTYDSDVVKKTVELSQRYITDRSLPDSAIDVIDLSGAYTCLIDREPQQISNMRKRLIEINKERSERLNKGDFEFIDSLNKDIGILNDFVNTETFNNQVIIDCGYNFKGGRCCGDFDPNQVSETTLRQMSYTPTPHGTGVLTVCGLLENTIRAFKKRNKLE